jgi:hypothetical protein
MRTPSIPFTGRLAGTVRLAYAVAKVPLQLAPKAVPVAVDGARKGITLLRGITGMSSEPIAPPPVGPARPKPVVLPPEVADEVSDLTPGAELAHADLPLDDYDHLTLGALRSRLTKLEPAELVQLLDYERAHAHRLPVVMMFENRLRKLGATVPEPART